MSTSGVSFGVALQHQFPQADSMIALHVNPVANQDTAWIQAIFGRSLLIHAMTWPQKLLETPNQLFFSFSPTVDDYTMIQNVDVVFMDVAVVLLSGLLAVLRRLFQASQWAAVVLLGADRALAAIRDLRLVADVQALESDGNIFGHVIRNHSLPHQPYLQEIQGKWSQVSRDVSQCFETISINGAEVRSNTFGFGHISGSRPGNTPYHISADFPGGELVMHFEKPWECFSFFFTPSQPGSKPFTGFAVRSSVVAAVLYRELVMVVHDGYNQEAPLAVLNPQSEAVIEAKVGKAIRDTPDKFEIFGTVSHKLKWDLSKLFADAGRLTVLEIGGHFGYTSRVLSDLFGRVIVMEKNASNIAISRRNNADRNNIFWLQMDAYVDSWTRLAGNAIHVVFIDALHDYGSVLSDIYNSFIFPHARTLVFDDYGLPHFDDGVRAAVDFMVAQGQLNCNTSIGHEAGTTFTKASITLNSNEGVVCTVLYNRPPSVLTDTLWFIFSVPAWQNPAEWALSLLEQEEICANDMWLLTPPPHESMSNVSDSGAVYFCRDEHLGTYRSYDDGDASTWPYKSRKFTIEISGMSFGILFGRKLSSMYAFQLQGQHVHVAVEAETLWGAIGQQHSSVQFCRNCDARGGRVSDTARKLRETVKRLPAWQLAAGISIAT